MQAPIKFKTGDNVIIDVNPEIYEKMGLVKTMIDGFGGDIGDNIVPIEKIDSKIFNLVIKWTNEYIKNVPNGYEEEKDEFNFDYTEKDVEREIQKEIDDELRVEGEPKPNDKTYLQEWAIQFFESLDVKTILIIAEAANYLELKPLLNDSCKRIASIINGKTTEEMREIFGIVNDFTLEEMEEIEKQTSWVYTATDNTD